MEKMPAIGMAAMPGKRQATIDIAEAIEKKGFSGIYTPSLGDPMALCQALVSVTREIPVATSIMPIYFREVADIAQTAAFIHEVSGGRFTFGVGVSHGPMLKSWGISGGSGKPLTDMRNFVKDLVEVPDVGELPPIILAALRKKMISLSEEIAQGTVFANVSRSHMKESLGVLSAEARQSDDFFIGNMIPTCINDDIEVAKAVNRKTLTWYASLLPNYRNYWREAGYVDEMDGFEKAIANNEPEKFSHFLTDRWLADSTLFGPASTVIEGVEAWFDAGVKTPILVVSSANGGQLKAFEEAFAIF
jgi:alkanesulfonate monooxygenase SsuD/methylene tetrahydromethanopterin reductase-like flavin-dependent oxidoreductase (luciferase family)